MESADVQAVDQVTDRVIDAKNELKQIEDGVGVIAKNGNNKRGFSSSNDRRDDEKTGRGGYGRFRRRGDNQQRPPVDSFDDRNQQQQDDGRSYRDYDRNGGRDFRYNSRMVVRGRGENGGGRYNGRHNYQIYDQINDGSYGYNKFYAYSGFVPRRYGYTYRQQDYENYYPNYGYGRQAYRGGRRDRNFNAHRQSSERSRREKDVDGGKIVDEKSKDEKTQSKSRRRKSSSRQRREKYLENPMHLTDGILIKIFENMDFETRFSAEQVCRNWMRNMSKVRKPAHDAPTNVRLIVKRPEKEYKQKEIIDTKYSAKENTMVVTVATKVPYMQHLIDRLCKIVAHLRGGIAHFELHNIVINTGIFNAIASDKVDSFLFDRCRISSTDFDIVHNFCKIFAEKITVSPSTFDASPKKSSGRSKHRRRSEKATAIEGNAENQKENPVKNEGAVTAGEHA